MSNDPNFTFDINDEIYDRYPTKTGPYKRKTEEDCSSPSKKHHGSRAQRYPSSEAETAASQRQQETRQRNSSTSFALKNRPPAGQKRVVRRKFPGPAGLLSMNEDLGADLSNDVLCSQMSVATFSSSAPWAKMMDDYGDFLPEKYNIAWIKDKAGAKKLIGDKAPFLAGLVQSIECSKEKASTVSLVLADPTGEIEATVPYKLYEDHANELVAGSVIILKQVSVLTLNFGRSHYLIITSNSLMGVYYLQKGCGKVECLETRKLSVEDVISNIRQVQETDRINNFKTPIQVINKIVEHQHIAEQITNKTDRHDQNFNSQQKESKFTLKSVKEKVTPLHCDILEKKNSAEVLPCSQIVIRSENPEHDAILQSAFEGVDADSFFTDF